MSRPLYLWIWDEHFGRKRAQGHQSKNKKFIRSIPLKKEHHHFTTNHKEDYFLTAIRKHIQEKEIEFIVMGTHGVSELKEFS